MIWHFLGASLLLALLKWRRILEILRDQGGFRSPLASGYVFASLYALFAVPITLNFFDGAPMPRFNDIFLVGIALTAYFFRWEPATYLLIISVLASAWILPPYGSMRVAGFSEWYRLLSFTAVSIFIVLLLTRMKVRQAEPEPAMRVSAHSGD
jgi:hypothetical protein